MSKHTPGPWHVDMKGCAASKGLPTIEKANHHLIATMCETNEANARLIAAAPDLLEALKKIEELTSSDPDTVCWFGVEVARAAIAKAEETA